MDDAALQARKYRERADVCRNLAKTGSAKLRASYAELAKAYERLADEIKATIKKKR